jgi:TonB family protein
MNPRRIRLSISLVVLFRLLSTPCLRAQNEIPVVPTDEAMKHLTKRVEPTKPAIAKLTKTAGPVSVDVVIGPDGSVESVTVSSGAPILSQAARAAIKQWKFDLFIENGDPVRVRALLEVVFPNEMLKDEQSARQAFLPAEDRCRQLVNEQRYSDAERSCADAIDEANKLPSDAVLERSTAQSLLGDALILQGKAEESLPHDQEALRLDQYLLKPNDADLASNYANLGRAYFRLGDFEKGDPLFRKAVESFEAAMVNLPRYKQNYTRRLKNILLEYARFKRAAGENEAADALEARANRLGAAASF